MAVSTDRIEKRVRLRAPLERVWRAIGEAKQFGRWFGVAFERDFVAGEAITGTLVPTSVDAEVGKEQEAYAGLSVSFHVDRIEPMRLFSFRWHPYALDPAVDYAREPMTLVVFELAATAGGTMLTITESGFDRIPLARRAKAFSANDGGWEAQAQLLEKYVTQTPA